MLAPATDADLMLCGVRLTPVGPDEACSLVASSQRGDGRAVHLCNAYTLSLALRSGSYRQLLNGAELNFADGYPVAAVGRRWGHGRMTTRVYGPDLFLAAIDTGRERQLRHYLYGGSPHVVRSLEERLRRDFPGVLIVGAESPPFRPLDAAEVAQMRA